MLGFADVKREHMKKRVNVKDLGKDFMIFGNKGNVWTGTAHAYKMGTGNICGTPALSSNHALFADITEVGCPDCLKLLDAKKV
jgi:hypothetical protein